MPLDKINKMTVETYDLDLRDVVGNSNESLGTIHLEMEVIRNNLKYYEESIVLETKKSENLAKELTKIKEVICGIDDLINEDSSISKASYSAPQEVTPEATKNNVIMYVIGALMLTSLVNFTYRPDFFNVS